MRYLDAMSNINRWLKTYRNPVVMMSFGKDSMAMGFIVFKMMKLNLPVLYFRDPWDANKNEWPDKIIRDWKLEVYDYPPMQVRVKIKGEFIELCPTYQIGNGPNGGLDLPKAILEPGDGAWHCGLKILERPKGTFEFPWDLILIGHKSADVDRFAGPLRLKSDLVTQPGIPTAGFPLKDWSHDDVWSFIENFDVPYQRDRYLNRIENPDKTNNNDYLTACTNCVDPRKSGKVFCPLVGHEIDSVAHLCLQAQPELPSYVEPN